MESLHGVRFEPVTFGIKKINLTFNGLNGNNNNNNNIISK